MAFDLRRHHIRRLGNWVNLSTPLGLAVARVGRATVRPGPRGLLLADGYLLGFPVASAFTIGDVLLTSAQWSDWAAERPTLLEHEERHSWQWFCLLGLPFLPAYALAMGWSMLRTGDRAAANIFERRAGLLLGGYREVATRPLLPAARSALEAGRRRFITRS